MNTLTRCLVVVGLVLSSVAHAGEPTLAFHGNKELGADAIRAYLIAETPTFLEPTGEIDQEAVERAAILVSAFYWDRGYANVRQDDVKIDPQNHRIDFHIKSEGDRFTIKNVVIKGTLLRTERTFLAMLAVKPGNLFSRTQIANDRQKLQRFYEDRAYAYVNVLPLTKVDLPSKTITLTFEIDQGELSFVGHVKIAGNTKTSTQTILDTLSFKPGEPYHGGKLEASLARLRKLFTSAVVSIKRGSAASTVDVTVEIDE